MFSVFLSRGRKKKHVVKVTCCKSHVAAAETRFLLYISVVSSVLVLSLISRASQRLFLHRGNAQKAKHSKVIGNKVLKPPRMRDMQSVRHTWLLPDKTLSSSNTHRSLLLRLGDKKTLPLAFRSFQVLSGPPHIQ